MSKNYGDYRDVDSDKYESLKELAYKISTELFEEGFSKDSVYTFLHTVVGVALYEAEIGRLL